MKALVEKFKTKEIQDYKTDTLIDTKELRKNPRYHAAIVRLQNVLSPNHKLETGNTLLMDAAYLGCAPLVSKLLADQRVQVNCSNKNGDTALHLAAAEGHAHIVEILLLDKRIDVYSQTAKGDTAFHLAALKGKIEVISVFLRCNVDYRVFRNGSGQSVLDILRAIKKHISLRERALSEFENMDKIRIAIAAWKNRQTDCINPLPDELIYRFKAFAQDALRQKPEQK